MFGITQEGRATIYLLGENPDEQGAGRQYRLDYDELKTLRTLMRGGVGFIELHRAGYRPTALDDIINVAAIAYIERYIVAIKTTARVELWQAPGIGTVYIVDPDEPGRYWLVVEASRDARRFADEASALVDGEHLELSDTNSFLEVDVTRIEPLVKVAEWKAVGTQGAGAVDVLVSVIDLAGEVVDYIGADLLEGLRKREPVSA